MSSDQKLIELKEQQAAMEALMEKLKKQGEEEAMRSLDDFRFKIKLEEKARADALIAKKEADFNQSLEKMQKDSTEEKKKLKDLYELSLQELKSKELVFSQEKEIDYLSSEYGYSEEIRDAASYIKSQVKTHHSLSLIVKLNEEDHKLIEANKNPDLSSMEDFLYFTLQHKTLSVEDKDAFSLYFFHRTKVIKNITFNSSLTNQYLNGANVNEKTLKEMMRFLMKEIKIEEAKREIIMLQLKEYKTKALK